MSNDQCVPHRSINDQPVRPQKNKYVHFVSDVVGSEVGDRLVAPNDAEPEIVEEEHDDTHEDFHTQVKSGPQFRLLRIKISMRPQVTQSSGPGARHAYRGGAGLRGTTSMNMATTTQRSSVGIMDSLGQGRMGRPVRVVRFQMLRAKAQFYAFVIADHSLASGIWFLLKEQDLLQLVHWSRKFCMM